MKRLLIAVTLLLAVACQVWAAEVELHALFADDMVLQQGDVIPVWGTAPVGETVKVTIGDRTLETKADEKGKWRVNVGPLAAGGPYEMTVAGRNTITLKNVMVGEVWLCSGQSNMAWTLRQVLDADKEIAAADLPNVRLYSVRRSRSDEPAEKVDGKWEVCSPKTAVGFSAVGYLFGSELHKARNVPVGLINSSWGGTKVEAWTSLDAQKDLPAAQRKLKLWEKYIADYPAAQEAFKAKYEEWKAAAAKAKEDGTKAPRRPRAPHGPNSQHRPGVLYNGMIAPLIPFAIRGAIWYQGEGNAGDPAYREVFATMIRDWRTRWGRGDFPFACVQLPDFHAPQTEPSQPDGWVLAREGQLAILDLPNTGVAVTLGLGEAGNIHPKNKRPVGERLALWARATVYGEDIVYSGPTVKSHKVEGNRIRVTFDHIGDGLKFKDGKAEGFAIAGKDGKFVWATAEIDGGSILVSSPDVAEPVAVRYAWAPNPKWSLINSAGLPASPFRTDTLAQ